MGCVTSRRVEHLDSNVNKSTPPARPVLIRVREPLTKKVVKAKEKPLVLRNVSSSDSSSLKNDGSASEADCRSSGEGEKLDFATKKAKKLDDLTTRSLAGPRADWELPLHWTGEAGQQTEMSAPEYNHQAKARGGGPASKAKTDAKSNYDDTADTETGAPGLADRDIALDSNEKDTNLRARDDASEDATVEAQTQTEVHREAWGEPDSACTAGKQAETDEEKNTEVTEEGKTQQNIVISNKQLIKPKAFPKRTQAEQKEILQQLREEGILSSVTGVRQGGVAFFVPSQSETLEAQTRPPRVLERLKPYKSHRRGHYTLEEKLLIAEILRDEKLKQHGAMARRFEQRRRKLLQDKNDKFSEEGEEDYEAIPEEAVAGVESRIHAREDWPSRRTSDEDAACESPSACPDS